MNPSPLPWPLAPPHKSAKHLVLILFVAAGIAVYQYGQRQHEVGTLCAALGPPRASLNFEQQAAHDAARAVCKTWAPRPKRTTAMQPS
jgi:hypothetical protein